MWQTVDYKGNTVKWYEAELIEQVKSLLKASCSQCKNCEDFDDCAKCGKQSDAQTIEQILDLIQENEE